MRTLEVRVLGYVAVLWIAGVVCLVAAIVGGAVKLGGSELPAGQAVAGDLFYQDVNVVAGQTALLPWAAAAPPALRQCADLLAGRLGEHTADARPGAMGCLATMNGRTAWYRILSTSNPNDLSPSTRAEVTVWEEP